MQTAGALLVAVITAVVLLMLPGAPALDNGLGQRSPLGFNSWNYFGCNINESLVLEVADHFLASGMAAAGYDHINLDESLAGTARGGEAHSQPRHLPEGTAMGGKFSDSFSFPARLFRKWGITSEIYRGT